MIKVKNRMVSEFEENLRMKRTVCFCAGQGLHELCEVYPLAAGRISYIVDNYCHGRSMELGGHEVPVVSMEEIQGDIKDAMLVVTSIQYADEIIKQLDALEVCNNLEVFIPALLKEDKTAAEPEGKGRNVLPKLLHYCWFGKGEMPKRFQRNMESWKRVCPDYEIIRWDESNYDYTKNNYMRQAYEAGKWGFVPDYARLDIINTYGGIYLDTDVELLKPPDDFLQFRLFCGFENIWFVNFGLGFGGMAGHPILREMMALYDETDFVKPDKSLNLTASPVYQTRVLAEHGLKRNGCCQIQSDFAAFSTEYFSPINAYGMGRATANTCSIHQYAATWFGEKQREMKKRTEKSMKFVMERI